jgi:hypothetical protein
MGINKHPGIEEIVAECSDPKWAVFCCMIERIGLHGWMTQLEYTYYRPDTPANRDFNLTIMRWPEHMPATPMTTWVVIRIPRAGEGVAKSLLWQHGLKFAGSKDAEGGPYVPIMIGGGKTHKFPLFGENIFHLENHSDGAKNVAYTNDPEKIKAAHEHEESIVKRFHDEHAAWLAVPENYAAAEAYWAQYPDEYPPEQKPDFTGGQNPDIRWTRRSRE